MSRVKEIGRRFLPAERVNSPEELSQKAMGLGGAKTIKVKTSVYKHSLFPDNSDSFAVAYRRVEITTGDGKKFYIRGSQEIPLSPEDSEEQVENIRRRLYKTVGLEITQIGEVKEGTPPSVRVSGRFFDNFEALMEIHEYTHDPNIAPLSLNNGEIFRNPHPAR